MQQYLMQNLYQLPSYKMDSIKGFLLYFIVTALLKLKAPFDKQQILQYIQLLQVQPLQFKYSTLSDAEPTIVNSYTIVAILKQLSALNPDDKSHALQFVHSLTNPDGSVRFCKSSTESDLRMVYSAVAYLDMLDIQDKELFSKFYVYVMSCQNPDGAFGLKPMHESHAGATYCAIATLKMIKADFHSHQLVEWLVNKQCSYTGGMAGRINKIPDSCYSFWVGWTLAILGHPCILDKQRLSEFVSHCYSELGGYSKYPDVHPDVIHTLHSLFGLDIEAPENDYVHAILNQ